MNALIVCDKFKMSMTAVETNDPIIGDAAVMKMEGVCGLEMIKKDLGDSECSNSAGVGLMSRSPVKAAPGCSD